MASTEQYTDSLPIFLAELYQVLYDLILTLMIIVFAYTVSRRITKQELNTVELLGSFIEAFELLILRKRTLTI